MVLRAPVRVRQSSIFITGYACIVSLLAPPAAVHGYVSRFKFHGAPHAPSRSPSRLRWHTYTDHRDWQPPGLQPSTGVQSKQYLPAARVKRSSSSSSTSLFFIDPIGSNEAIDTIANNQNAFTDFFDAFSSSFSSRVIGTILGNILAAAILKYITDYLWSRFFTARRPEPEPFQRTGAKETNTASTPAVAGSDSDDIPLSGWLLLVLCVMLDIVGDSSFALPGVGELEDVGWAPISAFAVQQIFGSNLVAGIDLVKEALPGTDILPVATIAWILRYKFSDSPATKLLGIKSSADKNDKS